MPEVIIKAKAAWYPEHVCGYSYNGTEKPDITVQLARKLPGIIAEAFNKVFHAELTTDQVVFDIQKYHALASDNQPDIGITISPSWTEKRAQEIEDFCDFIYYEVERFLASELEIMAGTQDYPQIDIMIKMVVEAGIAANNNGDISSTW